MSTLTRGVVRRRAPAAQPAFEPMSITGGKRCQQHTLHQLVIAPTDAPGADDEASTTRRSVSPGKRRRKLAQVAARVLFDGRPSLAFRTINVTPSASVSSSVVPTPTPVAVRALAVAPQGPVFLPSVMAPPPPPPMSPVKHEEARAFEPVRFLGALEAPPLPRHSILATLVETNVAAHTARSMPASPFFTLFGVDTRVTTPTHMPAPSSLGSLGHLPSGPQPFTRTLAPHAVPTMPVTAPIVHAVPSFDSTPAHQHTAHLANYYEQMALEFVRSPEFAVATATGTASVWRA